MGCVIRTVRIAQRHRRISNSRNLHVVAELKVGRELQSLSHRNVTPSLEHHHGDWATRESVADDQLSNNVETDLLVGNSLDDTNGDDVHEGDDLQECISFCVFSVILMLRLTRDRMKAQTGI